MTGQPGRGWPAVLTALLAGEDLSTASAAWAMDQIMAGDASPAQVAGFLVALRAKGETVAEMRGMADTMLAHAERFTIDGDAVDVVGTGGDRAHTVNISTMAALVVAGAGVRVVKHGNRSASSSSGSADVLEALGLNLTLSPARVAEIGRRVGLTFCFAQTFHPAMRHAAVARRDLGIGTAFNFLGPLTNPAQPRFAAVGVADARMAPLLAGVFADRGQSAAVFRGDDGLDELTISTSSTLWWVAGGQTSRYAVKPAVVGIAPHPLEALRGADAAYNAAVVRQVLAGEGGPVRDAVVLNAGIALAVAEDRPPSDQAGFERDLRAGMDRAEASIDGGDAAAVLDRWIAATREV
ncbi:MAG TPA: anthranilate phosphoribosyltransferase [Dermatophilaceae bacterium]|nr:anthranilate phosphoribosyltransferase [Dermatophilaceae bacterium]